MNQDFLGFSYTLKYVFNICKNTYRNSVKMRMKKNPKNPMNRDF